MLRFQSKSLIPSNICITPFDLEGHQQLAFALAQGNTTNSEVEALVAYQGIMILSGKAQGKIVILGNSSIIIWGIVQKKASSSRGHAHIVNQILSLL
jgi:hypothetical protein